MIFLLAYDIENNRIRTRLADRLLELGMERIQYSVFLGMAPEIPLTTYLDEVEEQLAPQDRIYLFRLQRNQVEQLEAWGIAPDLAELLEQPLTIIL